MCDKEYISARCLLLPLLATITTHNRSMKPASDILNQPIEPSHYILRALSSWASIVPNIPASGPFLGSFGPDLCARQAFVMSIVPFLDIF